MRIALLQINSQVGNVAGNLKKIVDCVERLKGKADLFVTPELVLLGYPPRDLLSLSALLKEEVAALQRLRELTAQHKCALLVGHSETRPPVGGNVQGPPLWNTATLFVDGEFKGCVRKQRIPGYDIFSEERFFAPWRDGPQPLLECRGVQVGLAICEDAWDSVRAFGARDVRHNTSESNPHLSHAGADLLINLSASPYSIGKRRLREALMAAHAARLGKCLLYANCVGGNDDVLFDGAAFAVDAQGKMMARAGSFREEELLVEWDGAGVKGVCSPEPSDWDELHKALVCGLRDFVHKNGGQRVVLGLSGGVDSALCAVLACEAVGPKNVLGVSLPSALTSDFSKNQARELAENIGCEFREMPIADVVKAAQDAAAIPSAGLAYENLQSRSRGLLLMAIANHEQRFLLATGNKPELAMGYSTLYGDMNGALLPLGDLYKTEVYGLSHYLNSLVARIPLPTLTRAPTAELAPGQKDADSLPNYEILDGALRGLIENQGQFFEREKGWRELLEPRHTPLSLLKQMHAQEFKRRQAAPILRVHGRAFGQGWQMPVAKKLSLGEL